MPTAVDAVTREHVEAFYAWLLETGDSAASVKNRHDGIRVRSSSQQRDVLVHLNVTAPPSTRGTP